MYTPAERDALRDALVALARLDRRITAVALTGSAAIGAHDEWSDIDLAFSVAGDADRDALVAAWTDRLYGEHGAVHHTDVLKAGALFRVFLLGNTLQVDLAFWPEQSFGAVAPTFRLLFGSAKEQPYLPAPSFEGLVGMAWLHALHARSSLARGRAWQAEYMISGVRDHVLALACLRHGLSAVQGRGIHQLPASVTTPLAEALVRSLDPAELGRAHGASCRALLGEVAMVDPELAGRLAAPLRELAAPRVR